MAFQLKQTKQRNGRIYLEIVDSVYIKSKGYAVPTVIKKIGYLDDEQKTYVDPIAFYKAEAKRMEEKRNVFNNEGIPYITPEKRLGYFLYHRVLKKLNLSPLFDTFDRESKAQYKIEEIFNFLTYTRAIYPASKIESFNRCYDSYFETYNFSDSQMYAGLQKLGEESQAVIEYVNMQYENVYGKRDLSKTYFDCSNFYFEIDQDCFDYYKQSGPSKENHIGAIIGMGLLLDAEAIPYTYKIYPGNGDERPIHREVIADMKEANNIRGKVIRVADKGLNSAENIIDAKKNGDGYIFSRQVKRIRPEEKATILSEEGWFDVYEKLSEKDIKDGKTASYLYSIKVWIDNYDYEFETKTHTYREKRLVIYSPSYAKKEKLEREKMLLNADKKTLGDIKRDRLGTATKYYDLVSEDGNLLNSKNTEFVRRNSKIAEDEEMDGIYMIVTSEINLNYEQIREIYGSLWEIEESFRILKTQFETRPIHVSTLNAIFGHFLTCYVALFLTRVLQKKELVYKSKDENGKEITVRHSASEIIKFAKHFKAFPIGNEKYHLTGYTDVLKTFEIVTKKKVNKRVQSEKELKNFFTL